MEPWREELYHHGILGQKWGRRRYQYEDGTLTPAGKKRYNKLESTKKIAKSVAINTVRGITTAGTVAGSIVVAGSISKNKSTAFAPGKDGKSSAAEKMSNKNSDMFAYSKKINKSLSNLEKPKIDITNMSDDDLRKAVNRMALENNYKNLMSERNVSKGYKYTNDSLEILENVVGIGASAVGMAAAIYYLKNKIY